MASAQSLSREELIRRVRAAIHPAFPHWVLFTLGTHVILDAAAEQQAPEENAIRRLKEFGPVHAGSPAGDFSVVTLLDASGWVVSGHGRGIYTYVHPSEMESSAPTDLEVGLFGRSKRGRDAELLEVIHVNAPGD